MMQSLRADTIYLLQSLQTVIIENKIKSKISFTGYVI